MQFISKLSIVAAVTISLLGAFALPTDSMLETRAAAKVYTKCTKPKTVALTFDDGPYAYIYDISKALVAAGAKGYGADNAKRVKYAYDKGHQVGP